MDSFTKSSAKVIAAAYLKSAGLQGMFPEDGIAMIALVDSLADLLEATYESGFFDGELLGRCPDVQWSDDWPNWQAAMRRHFNDIDVV